MGFGEAIGVCFTKYVVFAGRASRSEYWLWVLFTVLASLACGIVDFAIGAPVNVFGGLFSLATFLPSLAVSIRRLHDIDRSGWWLLLCFVPLLGWIALLIFDCLPGTPGPNRFGPSPYPAWPNYRGMAA